MGTPLQGYDADVWVSASPSIATTNESATDSGDHITYTASLHTAWDKTQPFTVQTAATGAGPWTTVTNYTVKWPIGQIVFSSALTPGTNATVRISAGSYFNLTQLDGAHSWNLALKGNTQVTTTFQPAGQWDSRTPTTRSGSGQIMAYRTDDRLTKELGNLLVMRLFVDETGGNVRWVFYAWVTDVQHKADISAVQEQQISFTVEGDAFFLIV